MEPDLIGLTRIRARVQQRPHRRKRAGSNRAMQSRDARAIDSMRIRTDGREVLDRCGLRGRVRVICVCRVVERLGSPSISRPDIRAMADQQLGHRPSKRRRSDVERRVAAIDIVADVGEEEVGRALPGCPFFQRERRETRRWPSGDAQSRRQARWRRVERSHRRRVTRAGVPQISPPSSSCRA